MKAKKDIVKFLRVAHKEGLQLSVKRINDDALIDFLERQGFSKRQITSIWKLIDKEKVGFYIKNAGNSSEQLRVSGSNGGTSL